MFSKAQLDVCVSGTYMCMGSSWLDDVPCLVYIRKKQLSEEGFATLQGLPFMRVWGDLRQFNTEARDLALSGYFCHSLLLSLGVILLGICVLM